MITLIKNITVYAPEPLGIADILLLNDKIEYIGKDISVNTNAGDIRVVDGTGLTAVPGYIDQHVHLIGGGGENGFSSRTPEVTLSKAVESGTTTVIGLLGTDGTARHMESLYAKAKGLEEEGLSTFIYTGSYEVPVVTMTGTVRRDIMLIDKIIGAGEIAISDHRSAAPTKKEIMKIAAEARVAGMLSRKAGVLHLHIGDGKDKLDMIFEILEESDIPIYHFRPTHVNRSPQLLEEAIKFAKMGGMIDITSSINPGKATDHTPTKGIRHCLDNGVSIEQITLSTDGNGSMPLFDANKNIIGLTAAPLSSLHQQIITLIKEENIPVEDAVKVGTSNIGDSLKLAGKGRLKPGYDADITIWDKDLNVEHVFAKGRMMMENKTVLVKGTFE